MAGRALRAGSGIAVLVVVVLAAWQTFSTPTGTSPPAPNPEDHAPLFEPPPDPAPLSEPPPLATAPSAPENAFAPKVGTPAVPEEDAAGIPNRPRTADELKEELARLKEEAGLRPGAPLRARIDPAAAGRRLPAGSPAPGMSVDTLVRDGLGRVFGTVELQGPRKPELEDGVPVGLTGRVVEAGTDLPVRDAQVVVLSAFYVKRIFYDHHLREVARTVTDADGEYRIDRLNVDPVHFGRGGRVFVAVTGPQHAPHPPIPLDGVSPGYRNRLADVVLSRGTFALRGRVLDLWEGKPVVGGRVVATGDINPVHFPKDQREALFLDAPQAETDEEGRFELENVGPGSQWISVHGGDDCIGYQMVVVPQQKEVELRTRQIRGRIEGTVVDELGRPVSLVKIDGGDNSTHTFANGSFVLENFRGDVVSMTFEHPEFRSLTVPDIPNGKKSLVVRMEGRWPTVRLKVTDADTREPLPRVALRLVFPPDEDPPLQPTSPWSLAADGLHSLRVPSGAAGATVDAEGYTTGTVDLRAIRAGDTLEVSLRKE